MKVVQPKAMTDLKPQLEPGRPTEVAAALGRSQWSLSISRQSAIGPRCDVCRITGDGSFRFCGNNFRLVTSMMSVILAVANYASLPPVFRSRSAILAQSRRPIFPRGLDLTQIGAGEMVPLLRKVIVGRVDFRNPVPP
jgi:hypothetical protein